LIERGCHSSTSRGVHSSLLVYQGKGQRSFQKEQVCLKEKCGGSA
jgi:hypothetical protein